MSPLTKLINFLTRPHPRIHDEEAQHHARLLTSLLLATIVSLSLIIVLVLYFDPTDINNPGLQGGIVVMGAALLLYGINYAGYTAWAVTGYISLLLILLLGLNYLVDPGVFLVFSFLPILMIGIFFTFRQTLLFIILFLIITFFLNFSVDEDHIWLVRMSWYFLVFASLLLLAFKGHLMTIERIRNRKLAQTNTQLQATLQAIPDWIFEVDRNGHLLRYHRPIRGEINVPWDEFVGKNAPGVFPEDVASKIVQTRKRAGETGKTQTIIFPMHYAGDHYWFEVAISPREAVRDAQDNIAFISLMRDITRLKEAEDLRVERSRLAAELEKEKEVAEIRSELISILTHEFRTPLSVILTSSSMLVKYAERLSTEKRNDKLEAIIKQVRRLDDMLSDVSTLAKSQRGFLQYQPEPIEPVSYLGEVVEELADIVPPNITITMSAKNNIPEMLLDKNLMRHAITNLVGNAVKYSPEGGTVTVTLRTEASRVIIDIHDEGIGIPAESLKNLFTPFHRASNVGEIKGTGLGLSIVKDAIELQGGTVHCKSQVNVGTTFSIRLPLPEKISEDASATA